MNNYQRLCVLKKGMQSKKDVKIKINDKGDVYAFERKIGKITQDINDGTYPMFKPSKRNHVYPQTSEARDFCIYVSDVLLEYWTIYDRYNRGKWE
jgi:hypothetical protein